MTEPAAYPPLSPWKTGPACRCPRCGKGKLYKGFLTLAPSCSVCGLDFSFADPADGPAFFSMSIVGLVIMGLFAWVEVAYRPPIVFHLVGTLPLLVIGCLATLRPIKGWLVASQYYYKAEEGKFEHYGKHGPF
ncbi:DUF983 domain-containing protein [Caulobacter sp. 17J80-11]|uniref:DUF983 domain-containing protein n=1 Tax=Caulobacter sp. 17J80-11 TaxID=2763502 RepID=UPI001653AE85|nr:DUF983 domain-containing protein [Caulobacter sp. 17J80-11]MBC6982715.1 DUF983 domain-containing protein [Caulobacter sp. 17J80-11]